MRRGVQKLSRRFKAGGRTVVIGRATQTASPRGKPELVINIGMIGKGLTLTVLRSCASSDATMHSLGHGIDGG